MKIELRKIPNCDYVSIHVPGGNSILIHYNRNSKVPLFKLVSAIAVDLLEPVPKLQLPSSLKNRNRNQTVIHGIICSRGISPMLWIIHKPCFNRIAMKVCQHSLLTFGLTSRLSTGQASVTRGQGYEFLSGSQCFR